MALSEGWFNSGSSLYGYSVDWRSYDLYNSNGVLIHKGLDGKKEDLKMNKTYEMWASEHFETELKKNGVFHLSLCPAGGYRNKVTITFHEEKKVEISESRLSEILKDYTAISRDEIMGAVFNQKEGE